MVNSLQLAQMSQIIQHHGISPLDVLIFKDLHYPLIRHYALFAGFNSSGYPLIVANYSKSVGILPPEELQNFSARLELDRVRKFEGSQEDKEHAFERVNKAFNKKPYDLMFNNCEHFANYVQYGNAYSQQTQVAAGGAAAVGLATTLSAKEPLAKALGVALLLAAAGSFALELSKQNTF
ncbi:lecithin retinol acyltransferase family protein [Saprospira grandis]|uniref:lecithin retinol acyltransferase family protein n=1 Tax=Saprospira grandis TaxID=1008 RepID=UPI0022DE466B|nr:lecithin retinol acyltransferase family protein [Saprospira grandis]WBM74516.1 lecithin retinol acyltransferase family protein [Saprospira grandis]